METFSAATGPLCGDSPVTGDFPSQRPVTQSFDVFIWSVPRTNSWVNNREDGDLRRHRAHYHVIVMIKLKSMFPNFYTEICASWLAPHIEVILELMPHLSVQFLLFELNDL